MPSAGEMIRLEDLGQPLLLALQREASALHLGLEVGHLGPGLAIGLLEVALPRLDLLLELLELALVVVLHGQRLLAPGLPQGHAGALIGDLVVHQLLLGSEVPAHQLARELQVARRLRQLLLAQQDGLVELLELVLPLGQDQVVLPDRGALAPHVLLEVHLAEAQLQLGLGQVRAVLDLLDRVLLLGLGEAGLGAVDRDLLLDLAVLELGDIELADQVARLHLGALVDQVEDRRAPLDLAPQHDGVARLEVAPHGLADAQGALANEGPVNGLLLLGPHPLELDGGETEAADHGQDGPGPKEGAGLHGVSLASREASRSWS